jgi:hypothetical protein
MKFSTVAACFLVSNAQLVSSQNPGDCVCTEGFIMDEFCINRGTLFDNPTQATLVAPGPEVHTIHCMVDVPQCVASGYTVLADNGDGTYSVAYRLDSQGDSMMKTFAEGSGAAGACGACDGSLGGTATAGFRATVIGTILELGDMASSDPIAMAHSLAVSEVSDSSAGCANFDPNSCTPPAPQVGECVCTEGFIMDEFCINRGTLFDNPTQATLVAPGPEVHTIHCMVDVPQCVASGYTVLSDNGNDTYSVAYRLDSQGDSMMKTFVEQSGAAGACGACDGSLGGTATAGFRATVIGRVLQIGNITSADPIAMAHSLTVTDVQPSSTGCANFDPTSCPATESGSEPPMAGSTRLVVSENPQVVIQYTVLTPESSSGLSEEEIAGGGVMDVVIEYEGEGWVGFAVSPDGRMVGSEAVIAFPPTVPEKYLMTSQDLSGSGVVRRPDSEQTLLGATVTQENGMTTMGFRKLLVEQGELELVVGGDNNFLWAVGNDNSLAYHLVRAAFVVNLQPGAGSGSVNVIESPNKTIWKTHGIMAALAWGVFAPLGIAASLLRSFIRGHGVWFMIHRGFMGLCVIFTIIAFSLAVYAIGDVQGQHFSITHQKVGLSVFVIALFQVLGGIFRPHHHPPTKDGKDFGKDEDDEHEATPVIGAKKEEAVEEGNEEPDEAIPEAHEKTNARIAFEIGHRVVGATLIGLSFYNINSGLQLYAQRFNNTNDHTTAFWAWIGAFMGVVLILTVYAKTRKN